ncbi:hypothetical protein CEXT_14761 [Caerostris extrusa]|uniref:Uncharacterized protein n=1 Tax=Caerostris extrusa TaxID=172846 RepID=A0AAV4SHJ6_CAEEX|nr:hypothetical protein CEXT_14761 [Caerostris extrusa]
MEKGMYAKINNIPHVRVAVLKLLSAPAFEKVRFEDFPVGFWRRLVAWLIDKGLGFLFGPVLHLPVFCRLAKKGRRSFIGIGMITYCRGHVNYIVNKKKKKEPAAAGWVEFRERLSRFESLNGFSRLQHLEHALRPFNDAARAIIHCRPSDCPTETVGLGSDVSLGYRLLYFEYQPGSLFNDTRFFHESRHFCLVIIRKPDAVIRLVKETVPWCLLSYDVTAL